MLVLEQTNTVCISLTINYFLTESEGRTKRWTERQTEQPTEQQTDQRTDRPINRTKLRKLTVWKLNPISKRFFLHLMEYYQTCKAVANWKQI